LTIALLYLLGRMPEEIEEAYETHLLECRNCLVRTRAVEHLLRLRVFHGGTLDLGQVEEKPQSDAVVIPFQAAQAGLWVAQRDWIQRSSMRNLENQLAEELDRAERELGQVKAALGLIGANLTICQEKT